MTTTSALDERDLIARNLKRLMATFGMSQVDVVRATGLDERTVRGVMRGRARPHARTVYQLAGGLGVDPKEFYVDLDERRMAFDRKTNVRLAEYIDERPDLFRTWSPSDFADLFSRFACGGAMTVAGIEAAIAEIELRREIIGRVALLVAAGRGAVLKGIVDVLCGEVVIAEPASSSAA